jgi:hypothetical protein
MDSSGVGLIVLFAGVDLLAATDGLTSTTTTPKHMSLSR